MEQGPSFRITIPKFPTKDPNHRILARQKSRFTHDYFYIRDEVMGPMVMRVATFFPFQTTYYLNRHSFIEQDLNRANIEFRNYAERTIMRSPRREVAARRGFLVSLTPHNSACARPCSAWPGACQVRGSDRASALARPLRRGAPASRAGRHARRLPVFPGPRVQGR